MFRDTGTSPFRFVQFQDGAKQHFKDRKPQERCPMEPRLRPTDVPLNLSENSETFGTVCGKHQESRDRSPSTSLLGNYFDHFLFSRKIFYIRNAFNQLIC